jgi:hypothetical protein
MLHHTDRSCMSATGVVRAARPSTPDGCIDSPTLHIYAVVPSAWCYRPYHCSRPSIRLSLHRAASRPVCCCPASRSAQDRGLLPVLRAYLALASVKSRRRLILGQPCSATILLRKHKQRSKLSLELRQKSTLFMNHHVLKSCQKQPSTRHPLNAQGNLAMRPRLNSQKQPRAYLLYQISRLGRPLSTPHTCHHPIIRCAGSVTQTALTASSRVRPWLRGSSQT